MQILPPRLFGSLFTAIRVSLVHLPSQRIFAHLSTAFLMQQFRSGPPKWRLPRTRLISSLSLPTAAAANSNVLVGIAEPDISSGVVISFELDGRLGNWMLEYSTLHLVAKELHIVDSVQGHVTQAKSSFL